MKITIKGALVVIGLFLGMLGIAMPTYAVTCPKGTARENQTVSSWPECSTEDTVGDEALMPRVQVIINVVLGVLGVVSVAMIIVGGIMYTTSQGQPDKVKQAKDILLYSIIGLAVALLAVAIVNFVLVNIFK